ncbi:hypothetical protein OG810_29010 [Streptomyces sp. NBC_01693]|uniref:hypothetical protein n=1 Tax=unclassified Streptomyces TaxID=2593676 RepID=UPI0029A34DDA|nr:MULTISPECIES: hypothetical protein [unclassified Streptomyces]MDX3429691.1 hypothetical protein [Streptomyces sp. ME01-18a]
MTDDEELYASDLLGRRLLEVTAEGGTPARPSRLRLHVEEVGAVLLRAAGPGLSLSADPGAGAGAGDGAGMDADAVPVTGGQGCAPVRRFVELPIRSVREVRHRDGRVDRACGLAFRFADGGFRVLVLDGELVLAHDRLPGVVEEHLHEDVTLAQVVRTCPASPSQWDAWTTDGQYLYLRYRHGEGSVDQHPSEDTDTWDVGDGSRLLTLWDDGTDGGKIALPDFLAAAGLRLAPDAEVSVLTSWRYRSGRAWAAPGEGASGAS